MKTNQAVKQKVCMMFLAVGIGLATVHEVGCFSEHSQVAKLQSASIAKLLVVKG